MPTVPGHRRIKKKTPPKKKPMPAGRYGVGQSDGQSVGVGRVVNIHSAVARRNRHGDRAWLGVVN